MATAARLRICRLEKTLQKQRLAIDELTLDRRHLQLRAQATLLRVMHYHALMELGQQLTCTSSAPGNCKFNEEHGTDAMDGFVDFLAVFDDPSMPNMPDLEDIGSDLASWDPDSASESATRIDSGVLQLPYAGREASQLPCIVDRSSGLNWSPASAAEAAASADLTASGLAAKMCRFLQHSTCLLM